MFACATGNKLDIKHEGGSLSELLKEKLQNVADKNDRKLCLEIGARCVSGKIRRICIIGNTYDCGAFMAEVEVGTLKDWAKNHLRPYQKGRHILEEDLGDSVVIRLCEGEYGVS
jgi:hypothetical protein